MSGYLEDHPRTCKCFVIPISREWPGWKGNNPIFKGPTNHGYQPLTSPEMVLQVVGTQTVSEVVRGKQDLLRFTDPGSKKGGAK